MVRENPKTSTRRISAAVGVPQSQVWRVIKREQLHPYHVQKVQRLEPGDEVARRGFCRWILGHRRSIRRILFTDEAQFTRDGMTNTKNSHVWSEENPHATRIVHSQHKFSLNVWCGLIDNKLIGPHFFEHRLTGEIYGNFLENELPVLLRNEHVNQIGMIFQHDGAPPHFSLDVRRYLDNTYPDRWIGRGGPRAWPARSPDLTPLDYFFWGHMKTVVYQEEVDTVDELRRRVIAAADEIRGNPDMIRRATEDLTKRSTKCIDLNGGHFEQHLH